jgi:hypothetical protein
VDGHRPVEGAQQAIREDDSPQGPPGSPGSIVAFRAICDKAVAGGSGSNRPPVNHGPLSRSATSALSFAASGHLDAVDFD